MRPGGSRVISSESCHSPVSHSEGSTNWTRIELLTSIAINVAARPQAVFDLARDVTRWPELLPHYRKVTVHSRDGGRVLVTMAAFRRLGPLSIPVAWRSRQWSEEIGPDDLRLRFTHVAGPTRGMEVTWRIRPT